MQKYRSQIQTAANKDEALTLAIGAAENLMKALKLSSNPDEKKDLKAQCGVLMDVADRIKKSNDWTPLKRQPETSNTAQIGQRVADVDASGTPGPAYEETVTSGSPSLNNFSRAAASANVRSTSGNMPFSSVSLPSQALYDRSWYRDDCRRAYKPLIDLLDDRPSSTCSEVTADTQHKDRYQLHSGGGLNGGLLPDIESEAQTQPTDFIERPHHASSNQAVGTASANIAPILPELASPSQIHRLTEPVSTRRRSKKEDIILLKASAVNGFKCPPWVKIPAAADFVPQNGQELFM